MRLTFVVYYFNEITKCQRQSLEVLKKNCFWLSLLLHALLLLSFLFNLHLGYKEPTHDLPNLSIPAYVSEETSTPASSSIKMQQKIETDVNGIKKAAPQEAATQAAVNPIQKVNKFTEPVNLVGNKKIKRPLLELLGKALTRTIVYPKIAMDFNLRGTSYIGFNLQPNGIVDEVRLMQSSGTEILDRAALTGVAAISPVVGVNKFLNKKRFLVVGIIFK